MQFSVDIFLQNKSSDFCSSVIPRYPSVSMRIKYSEPSNTTKFHSKHLNSVTAFVGQMELEQLLSRQNIVCGRKEWVNLLVWVSLQDRTSLVISLTINVNRIKYPVNCFLLIKRKNNTLPPQKNKRQTNKRSFFCQLSANMQYLGFGIKAQVGKTASECPTYILVLPDEFETNSMKEGMSGRVTLTFLSPTI